MIKLKDIRLETGSIVVGRRDFGTGKPVKVKVLEDARYDNAVVYGDARVPSSAHIFGNAIIYPDSTGG